MAPSVKSRIRDMLPEQMQVGAKYWYGLLRRSHEPELDLLKEFVAPGDLVIDIGGNRGLYAYELARIGANLHVFEPNPQCYGILSAWAQGRNGVRIHRIALSDKAGAAQLHVPVDPNGEVHDASGTLEGDRHPGAARAETVETRPLDAYGLAPAFIKIDVEGHESKVIQGARSTIAKHRPVLLVEIEQRHNSAPIGRIFSSVLALGYAGYFLADGRLHPLAEFSPERHQSADAFARGHGAYINNFLFAPTDATPGGRVQSFIAARAQRLNGQD